MVEALALAVESKDTFAVDHLHRMSTFTVGLGRYLGLKEVSLRPLRAAAVLHDIGQVAVPDHIIMKPGRLTPEEYDRLKVHPDVGADIIERAKFPYPVAPIVRAHHERWDGTGYPRGLKGENIPIEARVLAVVDTLVALTSQRHHRSALSLDKAIEVVRQEAGRGLDPKVVEALNLTFRALDAEARATANQGNSSSHTDGAASASGAESTEAPAFLATIAAARREEQSLLEFTQILGSSLNLQETLAAIARRFRRQIPFDTMVLYLLRDKRLESVFIEGENFTLFNLTMAPERSQRKSRPHPTAGAQCGRQPRSERWRAWAPPCVPLDGPSGVSGVLSFYPNTGCLLRGATQLPVGHGPKLATTVENSIRFREAENRFL